MNKVGLAVVTYKDNFGSALQTFATQNVIERMGYEVECISSDGLMKIIERKKAVFFLKRFFSYEEFKYIVKYIKSRLKKKGSGNYSNEMKIRHDKYVDFYKKYLKFSGKVNSYAEFSMLCKEYDAVVVGSDQLWRPSNIYGEYFTLEHVPEDIKKIAYSTSFGVTELPDLVRKKTIFFLNRIEHISVRENTGRDIIKKLINRDVPVVCDPTMLMTRDEWLNLVGNDRIIEGKYIVCYLMGENSCHREFVKRLRKLTGLKVVGLLHGSTYISSDEVWVDEKPFDVGPLDFINIINNSEYVCTDSFHCCVFSILLEKRFFVFKRDSENKKTSSNDRIYTLLQWTGLEECLLTGNEDVNRYISRQNDYSLIRDKVNDRRINSLRYLKEALKDENDKIGR